MSNDKLTFSMILEGDAAKRFKAIKKHYGLENNSEIIRILLFEKYKQLFPQEA